MKEVSMEKLLAMLNLTLIVPKVSPQGIVLQGQTVRSGDCICADCDCDCDCVCLCICKIDEREN